MRKYNAKINGTTYEIEIELVRENKSASGMQPSIPPQAGGGARPVPAAAAVPKPVTRNQEPVAAAQETGTQGLEEQIIAPMPGTVLSVKVTSGAAVKKGQILLSLEAMKMENEIMATRDGVVVSVNVSQGASVETGALLCVIK